MNKLRETMMQDLARGGYAKRTQEVYLDSIRDFAKYHGQSPEDLGQKEIRQWADHLVGEGLSAQRLRQHYAALRFLYGKTLARPELVSFLSAPKEKKRLPVVLSVDEVAQVLQAIDVFKYRVLCATIYGTGLRVSEACRLQTGDIDAKREVIHVRNGKGGKERLVGLSPVLLKLLRLYWKVERPKAPWMFTSRSGGPLGRKTLSRVLALATERSGIQKRVTAHTLRHCFATHLIEQGTDLRVIQILLGHASIRSTTRYAQVSTGMIAKTKSPLDMLPTSN